MTARPRLLLPTVDLPLKRLLRFAAALVLGVVMACDAAAPSPSPEGVWILTSDPTVGMMGCRMADNRGRLIAHPLTGLGIAGADGTPYPVRWPYGFSATVDAGRLALVDREGLMRTKAIRLRSVEVKVLVASLSCVPRLFAGRRRDAGRFAGPVGARSATQGDPHSASGRSSDHTLFDCGRSVAVDGRQAVTV